MTGATHRHVLSTLINWFCVQSRTVQLIALGLVSADHAREYARRIGSPPSKDN